MADRTVKNRQTKTHLPSHCLFACDDCPALPPYGGQMTLGEKIVLWCTMVAGLLLVASSALAGEVFNCPNLTFNNVEYAPLVAQVSSETCQYCTPWSANVSAYTVRHTWDGNGRDSTCDAEKKCGDESFHWVDNKNLLTISNTCHTEQCVPTHNPPTCTPQDCGESLPWKDSCGNDETPVVCDPCGCVPDPAPRCGENDCGKTLEYVDSCSHERKYVVCDECECIPRTECASNHCGYEDDGCGGKVFCGELCPPPPPPPGKMPELNCNVCQWAVWFSITHKEFVHFYAPNVVRQIVLDADEISEYIVYVGKKEIFRMTGPGIVTVPYEFGGTPIRQFEEIRFTGGIGRLTVFLDSRDQVYIRTIVE